MDIKTLESFRLADAIKFHDELNPKLWDNGKLRPEVKKQLKLIADDFLEELGISDLDVSDITVSGSNAAYSYTPHSDLDLHILVDMSKLENNEIYKELFTAKKNAYNDSHHIKIHGVPIELYIQDTNQPVISLGEYSLVNDKWLKLPTKRRANLDQNATKAKYEKLLDIINRSMVKPNSDKINDVIKTIKRYRQAGLDKGGEFGPENLAYKALRTQGHIDKLYDLRDKLHSKDLSIEEDNKLLDKPTMAPEQLARKHGVAKMHILQQLDMGIKVELEHTSTKEVAREIALDHLGEDPNYYTKLQKAELEEAFDQPYPITWEHDDYGNIDALATLDDGTYLSINFNTDNVLNNWTVEFHRNNSTLITGEGDSQRVFATVMTAIKQFINEYNPNMIYFSAVKSDDPKGSRTSLYDKLVQRFAASLGYTVKKLSKSDETGYSLSRIEKVKENVSNDYLYHATYRPLLKSIKKTGLGGSGAQAKWEDSVPGVVYLARDPDVAISYAEASDIIPDDWLDEIVVLKIPVSSLDKSKLRIDKNVKDNTGETLEYHGIIPFNMISLNEGASGYIPSNSEKNDPRYCMALTVDIKPDTMKKDAKKFGNKISRAGIPPTLKANGKF